MRPCSASERPNSRIRGVQAAEPRELCAIAEACLHLRACRLLTLMPWLSDPAWREPWPIA